MATPKIWDLVVIGGGSAGLIASKTAASFGARVLLIERDRLGGDCLWTGCVPSKTLIAAAHRAVYERPHTANEAVRFADAMADVKRAIAAIAPTDSAEALAKENVTVLAGTARFTSETTLDVDGTTITFRQAMIATGSSPVLPDIPGIDAVPVRTSDDVWELTELPDRMLIVGGGAIGCELGQAMARLGSAVTIVQRGGRILPKEDADASAIVNAALTSDGVSVLTNTTVQSFSQTDVGATATLSNGETLPFDLVVVALGRAPHADTLDVARANVQLDERGYVQVDDSLRTTNARIWAGGDVTPHPKFTHTAGVAGSIAATNAVLGLRRKAEQDVIPRVTFTAPEVAAVGMQSADADLAKHRVVTWQHTHADRAIAEDDTSGYTRIVVDKRGRILGGTIVGPRAGETLGELTLAVSAKLTTSTVAGAMHAYPTYSDALWNTAVADVRHRLSAGIVAKAIRALRWVRSRFVGRG